MSKQSKFKWSTLHDLTGSLLPIEIFNNGCETSTQIDELDVWIEAMADRLDQWATTVTNEVMKAAAAMQNV